MNKDNTCDNTDQLIVLKEKFASKQITGNDASGKIVKGKVTRIYPDDNGFALEVKDAHGKTYTVDVEEGNPKVEQ